MHRTTPGQSRPLVGLRPASQLPPVSVAASAAPPVRRPAATVDIDPLLTPNEVAQMFRVDPKTVTRWANAGKITTVRTLGGHRRFSEREIRTLLAVVPTQIALPA